MSVIQLPTAKAAEKDSAPDHTELAGYIGERDKFISNRGDFWAFSEDAGIWQRVPTEMLHRRIQEVCRQFSIAANSSRITGAEKMAHGVHYRDVEWDATDPRAIAVQNGVLVYRNHKWKLTPYRAQDYRRISLPITYDPNAKCPRFMQYLKEVFAGADDAQARIRALVEFMGLSLTATTEYERAILLLGRGGNGKSKVLNMVQAMVGPDYRAAVELSQLDNRFQQSHLDGKLINVMSETSTDGAMPDATIKKIISGETLTAERKFKDAFDFRPTCKLWLATNHLPSTKDFSDGLFRRFTILQFPNRFDDRPDVDTELDAKLKAETSGVLNFCLDALASVYDRHRLTTPASSTEIAQGWRLSSDQVVQFLDEAVVLDNAARTPSNDIYQLYTAWAAQAGIRRTLNRKNLTLRLEAHGMEYGKFRGTRTIFGIRERLASDGEDAK